MNNRNHIKKTFVRIGIILLLVAFMFRIEAVAQKIEIPASKLDFEKFKFDSTSQSILDRIIKPFKFKYNRETKGKRTIHEYMKAQIDKGLLKIDPAAVDTIMSQLESIRITDSSNNKSLNLANISNEKSIDSAKKSIQSINDKLSKKASKSVMDSLKILMSAVIQENENNNNQENQDLTSKVNKLLKEIEKVKYSGAAHPGQLDSSKKGDSMIYFRRYLKPKIKVIGWHKAGMNNKFKNYNFHYLSSINLYGYELSVTGKNMNPKNIQEFQKPGGVIALAHSKGCDIQLTIHNNNPDSISRFLKNAIARQTFLSELDKLIGINKLKGINVYFDHLKEFDSKHFVQFITVLHKHLKSLNKGIELNISIPANKDDVSLSEIAAYDFSELNTIVDYYLVLTDDLLPPDVQIAQSSSPLFNQEILGEHTIESTLNFYSNGKIPTSKLIMTVSYSGREWTVDNFEGTPDAEKGDPKTYGEIIKEYAGKKDIKHNIIDGFDPDQVSAYLNITGTETEPKKQIWFDDFRSLYLKYTWALENELGGVSIRGLGYDDGRPELWNSLGAALIKIDTTFVENPNLKISSFRKFWNIVTSTYHGFSLKIFRQDLQWARVVRLKYYDTSKYEGYTRFIRADLPLEESIANYIGKTVIWTDKFPCKKDPKINNECLLPDLTHCYYLYTRWTIYATFFFLCGTLFLILSVLFFIVSFNYERYMVGNDKARSIIRNVPSGFFLISILFAGFWLYLNPSFVGIGAGSEEGTNTLLMVYILLVGIAVGWVGASRYFKYKRPEVLRKLIPEKIVEK
jgi:spore germination protein YaaH/Txe/YoeB family toxin of Txe-Axe toxin-antitoxin module